MGLWGVILDLREVIWDPGKSFETSGDLLEAK